MLVGGALAGATYLMTRGARAETRPQMAGMTPGARILDGAVEAALGGASVAFGNRLLRSNPASGTFRRHLGVAARFTGLISVGVGAYRVGAGLLQQAITSARAETRPLAGGGSGGSIDISGTAVLAGGTAVAGYAGYRMLTRGAPAPAAVPAAAAAPGRLARGMGLLRRAALPLTALAVLNEASRGYNSGGASGALRGAGNALTFGALDMVAGALPARPATANSSAHASAVSGAQAAGVNAGAAIASLSNGSSVGSPGVAVTSDGMTAGYQRNRRLASGITISETVSGYATPVRR